MQYHWISFGQEGSVARITINRPEQRNALCRELLEELIHAFTAVERDKTIRVAVLTGAGKAFVAGADLKELCPMDAAAYLDYGGALRDLGKGMRDNSKVIVGVANGPALGGGNMVILSCDLILAAHNAVFSMAEINVGIFGGPVLLTKLFGRHRAAEFSLLGDTYTAERARDMGVVYKVVPPESLEAETDALLGKLLEKSPAALLYCKKSLSAGFKYDFEIAYEYQIALMSMLFDGPEQKEGMRAFLEKRQPDYQGITPRKQA